MALVDIFYWTDVALALYAAYLVCFCLYKVDLFGNKTDERIYVPRIVYLLALGISFVPILNAVCALLVIGIAIVAYYNGEDWYFKSWLLERPGDKKKETTN
jgi:predicted benzoate:H+ symporter BenE